MARAATNAALGEMLGRIDERVKALHEHVSAEIRPALAQLPSLRETVKWLKMGVIGIYGLFGSVIVALASYVYLK